MFLRAEPWFVLVLSKQSMIFYYSVHQRFFEKELQSLEVENGRIRGNAKNLLN